MLIYFFRHGQVVPNRDNLVGGWGDYPLTEKGQQQARELGEIVRALPPFDKIYVSDLLRTRQTFAGAFGADTPHELSPLIREVNAPFVGVPTQWLYEQLGEDFRRKRADMDYADYFSESAEEFRGRVELLLNKIVRQEGVERVAVVCHGGVIRSAVAIAMGNPLVKTHVAASNCSMTVIEWKNGHWKVLCVNRTPKLYGAID